MQHSDKTAHVRHPKFRVLADGIPVHGALELRLIYTDHFSPDRFQIRLHRASDPDWDQDCLLIRDGAILDLQLSLDGDDEYSSLLMGRGDALCYDHSTRSVRIEGRNLAGLLQDAPANDVFSNLTSSEIAASLALRHGLIPIVMPTLTFSGRYYNNDAVQIASNQFNRGSTEWDLLTFLARKENFELFVSGTQLYFQPGLLVNGPAFALTPDDVIDLRLRRRQLMSGDIQVSVKSWDSRQSVAVVETATSRRTDLQGLFSSIWSTTPTKYSLVQPNLSAGEAGRLAISRVEELTRHEVGVEITMPGELDMTTRSVFALQGTRSLFDQLYRVDAIERVIGGRAGFVQHISAHSVSSRQTFLQSSLEPI